MLIFMISNNRKGTSKSSNNKKVRVTFDSLVDQIYSSSIMHFGQPHPRKTSFTILQSLRSATANRVLHLCKVVTLWKKYISHIYIYICVYICIYICVFFIFLTCIHVYIYIYIFTYIYIYIHIIYKWTGYILPATGRPTTNPSTFNFFTRVTSAMVKPPEFPDFVSLIFRPWVIFTTFHPFLVKIFEKKDHKIHPLKLT